MVAELQIVIARFVFSYEQAFMADLVRFWYALLFLFASAYTLIEEGHVRVDVLYAGFSSERAKAWSNVIGSLLLGIPLCWIILTRLACGGKTNMINGPMLNYEVSQSGFGMYVKYLMASFLAIFYAVSMMIQFAGYMLEAYADYRGDGQAELESAPSHEGRDKALNGMELFFLGNVLVLTMASALGSGIRWPSPCPVGHSHHPAAAFSVMAVCRRSAAYFAHGSPDSMAQRRA